MEPMNENIDAPLMKTESINAQFFEAMSRIDSLNKSDISSEFGQTKPHQH